jgi:membrane-associated phospholipid phosphatase
MRGVLLAGLVLAALAAAALGIDVPLARWLTEHRASGDLKRLIALSEVFGWGGSVALIILAAATLDERGWRIVPRLLASSLGAGLSADAVKLFVARVRPSAADLDTATALETFVALTGSKGHAVQSFPSAHAATAVGLALGLAALYPKGRWLFLLFAAAACMQRLEAQAHFASDVLAGAALGCLVAGLVRVLPTAAAAK